jgi:hypothetical protein
VARGGDCVAKILARGARIIRDDLSAAFCRLDPAAFAADKHSPDEKLVGFPDRNATFGFWHGRSIAQSVEKENAKRMLALAA